MGADAQAHEMNAHSRHAKELYERHAVNQSPARIEELVKIFIHATKVTIISYVSRYLELTSVRWKQDFGTWEQVDIDCDLLRDDGDAAC